MMGMLQRADASISRSVRPQDAYSRSLRAAAARPTPSLVERVRTFVERTLDAAFGRFDH